MKNLRQQFEKDSKFAITEFMGRYNPVYVEWLEKKLKDIHDLCYSHEELPDGYYDTEAVLRDETLNEIIKLIER